MTMSRFIAPRFIVVAACGLALAACSSFSPSFPWTPSFPWAPSLDASGPKPATSNLTIESDPPGAEARTSQGLTCRTPCTLAVPVAEEVSVSYALNGYLPQSVTVRPVTAKTSTFSLETPVTTLEPNPVFAQLSSAKPAKPTPPKKKKRPTATAAAPVAAAPQQSLQSPYPPAPDGFTPAR
jgi:hypothetical protein